MIDYIIVGFGLAGLSVVDQLDRGDKTFLVFEDNSQMSSRVAGGLYNPVVLKRFTLAWQASELIKVAVPFYKRIANDLNQTFVYDIPVLRRFNSIEEQNLWFEAADKKGLQELLSTELLFNTNKALDIPYHYGKVNNTGRVDIKGLLLSYLKRLEEKQCLRKESFNYDNVIVKDGFVEYNDVRAKNIVFTDGFGLVKNPFFNYLPLYGNKGEYIIIQSKELQLEKAVKSSVFIIPLGGDLYKVGATYDNQDQSDVVTHSAREELETKLKRFLKVDYKVISQEAGIRPTVKDRRPMVGTHYRYSNVHILNGLGSRGVLAAPLMAQKLYNHIEKKEQLEKEIDVKRFEMLR